MIPNILECAENFLNICPFLKFNAKFRIFPEYYGIVGNIFKCFSYLLKNISEFSRQFWTIVECFVLFWSVLWCIYKILCYHYNDFKVSRIFWNNLVHSAMF